MKLKEFFKPTVGKIIVFIAFIAIFLVVMLLLQTSCIWSVGQTSTGPFTLTSCAFSYIATWFWVRPDLLFNPLGRVITLLGFVFDVIYWYFLSCIIIWIYRKVKKKK